MTLTRILAWLYRLIYKVPLELVNPCAACGEQIEHEAYFDQKGNAFCSAECIPAVSRREAERFSSQRRAGL